MWKMIFWFYSILINLYGAYSIFYSDKGYSSTTILVVFVLYVIIAVVCAIFFFKNLIYVCSPQYKIDKAEKDRKELDKIQEELDLELEKIALEREHTEKRKIEQNISSVKTSYNTDKPERFVVLKALGKAVLVVGGFFAYFTIGVIAKLTSGYMKKK